MLALPFQSVLLLSLIRFLGGGSRVLCLFEYLWFFAIINFNPIVAFRAQNILEGRLISFSVKAWRALRLLTYCFFLGGSVVTHS